MLLRILLLLLLPACALAQDCDCCKIRTLGQQKYDAGDYAGAKSIWETAKKMGDAAKCTDLKDLIAKAKKKIKPDPPQKNPNKAAEEQAKKQADEDTKKKADAEAAAKHKAAEEQAKKQADDLAWKYAQGTLLGCQRYLADYPQGLYVTEARQCEKDYADSDGDGILNKEDACPDEKGASVDKGCPPPPKPPAAVDQPIPSPATHGKKSGLTMIPVAGGTYTMGSPSNELNRKNDECQHSVTVGNFTIGQYEVTQADWQEVMGTNPPDFKDCPECPVARVFWNDVQEFIKAANKKYGRNFRLPSEAEWEYAARGGKKSVGYLYSGSDDIKAVAWYGKNAKEKAHTVGGKKANELGLYDMTGNVWEWCSDEWSPYPGCAEPKSGDSTRSVLRGGSWYNNDDVCRVAYRNLVYVTNRYYSSGFRLAHD
jgi:formylglycine-generating enzyme required for sulfatase activity